MMNVHCVFLVVTNGFSSRYFLRTGILDRFKAQCDTVVILSPNADEEYFIEEFAKENVFVERLNVEAYERYLNTHHFQLFCSIVRSFVLCDKTALDTVEDHYVIYKKKMCKKGFRAQVWLWLISFMVTLLRKSRLLRCLLLWYENGMFVPHFHEDVLKKYKPNVVVIPSLGNIGSYDYFFAREARAAKAKIVSVILSWDNTSGKGLAAIVPDHVVTWTEVMKHELIELHDMDENKIEVGGIAHFDLYYHKERLMSRTDLCARMGIPTSKKIILFATKSPTSYPWNCDVVKIISKAIMDGSIADDVVFIVRLHPLYFAKKNASIITEEIEALKELQKQYPCVVLDTPKILSSRLSLDMPFQEQVKLASLLLHADVVVSVYSTVNIEAAIFDVPIVNVSFQGSCAKIRSVRQNIEIDKNQVHNKRCVATGAIAVCDTEVRLIEEINNGLHDRRMRKKERERLVLQEVGASSGYSCDRVVESVLHVV